MTVASALTDLDDLELDILFVKDRKVSVLRHTGLRCGNEHANAADACDDTAFNYLDDLCVKNIAGVLCRDDVFHVAVAVDALFRELGDALDVAYADDECIDLVSDLEVFTQLEGRIVRDLFGFDNAGDFCADIELKLCVGNVCHVSGNGVSCI